MHIPDGFLDAKTAVLTAGLGAVGLGLALRRARRADPRRVPLLGLTAAFIFAAQMVNFPAAGGTSGHLVGAVLAAVLLGPAAAAVVMSCVLLMQCFMFADGGVTALGANILNMAIIAPFAGYGVYAVMLSLGFRGVRGRLPAAAFAAWCATVAAASACAAELALAGTVRWKLVLPAMAAVHMLIGLGEALITALVLAAVWRLRPELESAARLSGESARFGKVCAVGLLLSAGVVLCLGPLGSSLPDGLDWTAELLGFAGRAKALPVGAPFPDYRAPWISSGTAALVVGGCLGTAAVFALAYILARALFPGSDASPGPDAREG